ncbi:hypothetical protein Q3G72_028867 [Acer saccharum]|nr:hypothetical protein Q3G72_028867 [Acer saccharum]
MFLTIHRRLPELLLRNLMTQLNQWIFSPRDVANQLSSSVGVVAQATLARRATMTPSTSTDHRTLSHLLSTTPIRNLMTQLNR